MCLKKVHLSHDEIKMRKSSCEPFFILMIISSRQAFINLFFLKHCRPIVGGGTIEF